MSISKLRLLLVFIALALAVMLPMRWIDRQLLNDDTCCQLLGRPVSSPVLCFEFAWTPAKADAMLRSWEGKLHFLTLGFGLDFLFLLVYPMVFFLGLQLLATRISVTWLRRIAAFMAPVVLTSGVFDAVENICLLRYLFGQPDEWLLKTAGVCAGIKFGLLALGGALAIFSLFETGYDLVKNRLEKA